MSNDNKVNNKLNYSNVKQTQFDAPQVLKGSFSELKSGLRTYNTTAVLNDAYTHFTQTVNASGLPTYVEYFQASDNSIFTLTFPSNPVASEYIIIEEYLTKKTIALYNVVSAVGVAPNVADEEYPVSLTSGDPAAIVRAAYEAVLNTLEWIEVKNEGGVLNTTLKVSMLQFGASTPINVTNSSITLATNQTGQSFKVGEIYLEYDEYNNPIFGGQTLVGQIYNAYSASFDTIDKVGQTSLDNIRSRVDEDNSTSTPLTDGSIFYGPWTKRTTPELIVAPFSDQNFSYYIQFANTELSTTLGQPVYTAGSAAGIDSSLPYSYTAGAITPPRRLVISREWYRVVIVNDSGSNMTDLRFQTSIGTFAPLASKLNASLATDADAEVVRAIIAGDTLDENLNSTGIYNNVQLTNNNALKVNQVGEVIFQYIRPDDPQIPSGSVPTIDQVLNSESNVVDSGWLPVREFSTQNFHVIADQTCKVYLLNASDTSGSNWNGQAAAALEVNANAPANLAARFFDDYFRILLINDSGSTIDEITARSVGSNNNVQPIDISLDQPVFSFFPAPLTQSVQKGENPNGTFSNQKVGGTVNVSTTTTPLGIAGVFNSGIFDCSGYTQISTGLRADEAGTLSGVWYADAAGTQPLRTFTVPYTPSTDISWFSSVVFSDYISITYTNGATAQTEFYLKTELDTNSKHGQMLSLEAFVPTNSLVNINRAVLAGKNPSGVYQNVNTNAAGALQVSDFRFDIALGNISNSIIATKFGQNGDIDTGTAPEDVWSLGGVYTGQPAGVTAETITVSSSSALDASAGTGARTITLYGLDANYDQIEETITLNGTVGVTTSNTWTRMYKMVVNTAGTLGANQGTITATHTTTVVNVFGSIQPGVNQTTIAAITVPSGYTMYIVKLDIEIARGTGAAGSATVSVRARPDGGVYNSVRYKAITTNFPYSTRFEGAIILEELTDVKITVDNVSDNNTIASAEFEYILVQN